MRPVRWLTLFVILASTCAYGQEPPNPAQLKKMYDDALVQLKTVQDRRNEMAREAEALRAQVKELQGKLTAAQTELADLKQSAAEYAETTFTLRAHYAAWQAFLKLYPELWTRWQLYLGSGLMTQQAIEDIVKWPFLR
jgi:predicted nuclease with TOPRIM domain